VLFRNGRSRLWLRPLDQYEGDGKSIATGAAMINAPGSGRPAHVFSEKPMATSLSDAQRRWARWKTSWLR
jgi:hypothetical protein